MNNDVFAWTFPAGRLQQAVTSITLVNNTSKTEDITVGSGKRWLLKTIKVTNPDNVQRTVTIELYKEAAKTNRVIRLASDAVAAGDRIQIPTAIQTSHDADMGDLAFPLELAAGNTISITWAAGGASAGGTDADGVVLTYREVDEP